MIRVLLILMGLCVSGCTQQIVQVEVDGKKFPIRWVESSFLGAGVGKTWRLVEKGSYYEWVRISNEGYRRRSRAKTE